MNLEEIKQRKFEQLQERVNSEINEQQELQKQVLQIENLVKQYLTNEAISRYNNVKIAHPELAMKVLSLIAQAIQYDQIKEKISDEQFKSFLMQLLTKGYPKKSTSVY